MHRNGFKLKLKMIIKVKRSIYQFMSNKCFSVVKVVPANDIISHCV